jgi:hypothetical protein
MTTQQIADQAQAAAKTHPAGYGSASAVINGKTVSADIIPGCRNMGGRRKASLRWSVDGKKVAAANLQSAVSA